MKIKLLLMGLLLLPFLALTSGNAYAFSFFNNSVCDNTNAQGRQSSVCQSAQNQQNNGNKNPVIKTINTAANILALLGGLVAVIMIIVSGFTIITSAGNSEQITSSRRRIVAALVGLIIISLAWTIIRFVTDKVIQ